MRKRRRNPARVTLNLASMIDVTFLLLLYFMVSTILSRPEDKLSPALRTQESSAQGMALEFQPQILEVIAAAGGPAYRIGQRHTAERRELLAILEELPKAAGLIVKVNDRVPVGFAVAAVQCARDAGFEQVTYAPSE